MFGTFERMSEWRAVWKVRLEYARLADNGDYPYREVIVETPQQLRQVVEWARRDPGIIEFPYTRVRQRFGDEPQKCSNGHAYSGGGSPSRVRIDWSECSCGGHMSYLCPHCRDLRIDPAVWEDCAVSESEIRGTALRRLLPGLDGR
jgi:hypothetical protein